MKKKIIFQKIAAREFVSNIKKFETKSHQKENVFRPCLKQQEQDIKSDNSTIFTKFPQWD